ncbi:MAG TPA: alkaline phosphatase family protein [Gemmatimonadaceae bacterium]
MIRHWFFLGLASVTGTVYDQRSAIRARGEAGEDRNVILVVSDGLRWQEVFTGADSAILFGDQASLGGNADAIRSRYWRATVEERRVALMPFLWGTLARRGELLGNRTVDSRVDVENPMKFSYPGYNEMLVGIPDARIDRNDFGPNPNVTVFEWLNRSREFRGRVAAFGTWDVFHDIFNVERSRIRMFTNGSRPHDQLVQDRVLPFLRKEAPRALFVGFAETDDWGHEGRYDRFLEAIHAVDRYLEELWSAVQSHPTYRGRTTLIFTADHGRGGAPTDWRHHGRDVAGSEETFIIAIGPDVASRGERKGTRHTLGDVARATAAAVGQQYQVEQLSTKD